MTNILEYLEQSQAKCPEKCAISDGNTSVTYGQLHGLVQAIGSRLAELEVRNQPVGVLIRRNVESIIMFLGVVASGNFYVPIDPQMPKERMEKMLELLHPAAILGIDEDAALFPAAICYSEAILHPVSEELLSRIRREHLDDDPLYALFTSGSTGTPKSVVISHRGVIDLTEQFAQVFPFSCADRFGNQAPFDFDVSVKDIYQSLKQGATLVIIPKALFAMPGKLVAFLKEQRITTVIWAVSALRIIAQMKAFRSLVPGSLNKIMFSGEVMPVKVLNYWREHLPSAMYVNLYGPTEITCNCTYYIVDREYADTEDLPIGIPFPNTRVYLLNDQNQPCTAGELGEICVAGAGVALGYFAQPEISAGVFVQNPMNPCYRELIYRTGDMGSWNPDGTLRFLGRRDHQIKHMGHRIELGEVEAAVNALGFVDVSCCFYDDTRGKLVLLYQAENPCDKEILIALRDKLPKYMWPNVLRHRTEFPLNAHGKLDRVLMKQRYLDGTDL